MVATLSGLDAVVGYTAWDDVLAFLQDPLGHVVALSVFLLDSNIDQAGLALFADDISSFCFFIIF